MSKRKKQSRSTTDTRIPDHFSKEIWDAYNGHGPQRLKGHVYSKVSFEELHSSLQIFFGTTAKSKTCWAADSTRYLMQYCAYRKIAGPHQLFIQQMAGHVILQRGHGCRLGLRLGYCDGEKTKETIRNMYETAKIFTVQYDRSPVIVSEAIKDKKKRLNKLEQVFKITAGHRLRLYCTLFHAIKFIFDSVLDCLNKSVVSPKQYCLWAMHLSRPFHGMEDHKTFIRSVFYAFQEYPDIQQHRTILRSLFLSTDLDIDERLQKFRNLVMDCCNPSFDVEQEGLLLYNSVVVLLDNVHTVDRKKKILVLLMPTT